MEPVYLTKLASQHNDWLSVRQATIAENIANSDTPGFAARDVVPFASVFDQTRLAMTATHGAHMGGAAEQAEPAEVEKSETWQVTHSGNSVSLEQELMKAGEVARSHALNTSLAKSFHRMYLASVKG
ncbi:flagellar basal body rod protein FlgB [Polymorphum gilvum]|uniref:Flagellar basal-body rod protein B n=1 Tax=Polymorphum gilvum (strain LMG 25793 / CGMCC 1.9160 / SL003B-26A1) TaxID=991905 RepID=F2J5E2_POLGS|nr:flagellar basal body rod protein FlgB [Polymorphum gilvum]ADZ72312.1 Flagellar basal-body rod protein B [Polymorphum gilvum SL003B-26A1]